MKTRSTQFSSLCQRDLRLEQLECRRALDASAVLDEVPFEWHLNGPDDNAPVIVAEEQQGELGYGGLPSGDEGAADDILIYGAVLDPDDAPEPTSLTFNGRGIDLNDDAGTGLSSTAANEGSEQLPVQPADGLAAIDQAIADLTDQDDVSDMTMLSPDFDDWDDLLEDLIDYPWW